MIEKSTSNLALNPSSRMREAASLQCDALASRRSDFGRQCREWAASLDNAILRLNFKVKRTDDGEDERRRIFCERCCTRGRVRFNMRTSSAKNGTKLKLHGKGKKKKLNGGGGKKALVGRCEVCSHVVESLEVKERVRSMSPKTPLSDIQMEPTVSKDSKGRHELKDSSGKKRPKKKKNKRAKEEFAGLNLPKKPTASTQTLKAGDKKLLQMLRKNCTTNNSDDRLSAFLSK